MMLKKINLMGKNYSIKCKYDFSIMNSIIHYIRTKMNKIKWQENRQFQNIQLRQNNVPKNTEQANQLFIQLKQENALSQKLRMQRIDNILGTRTHFQETKTYQQRLDSDHLMELGELKRASNQTKRQVLNWQNPQADLKLIIKNKKRYFKAIQNLAIYPSHQSLNYDFLNQKDENLINFLAKQTLFTKISLKSLQLTMKSMQNESLLMPPQRPFESQKYCYFKPENSMTLLRTAKGNYRPQMLKAGNFDGEIVEQVISLDEIYETLQNYDMDERVSQYLKMVENNRLKYLFTDFIYNKQQNTIVVLIDLMDNGRQYCMIVKKMNSIGLKSRPFFNIKPKAVFSADGKNIFIVQRSPQGMWTQLINIPVSACLVRQNQVLNTNVQLQNEILYKCDPDKELKLSKDTTNLYNFLIVKDCVQEYTQKLYVISYVNDQLSILPISQDGNCKFYYDVTPLGLVLSKLFSVNNQFLKYGSSNSYSTIVYLVPFKQHIQLHSQQKDLKLLESSYQANIGKPQQFDPSKIQQIFKSNQNQFIQKIQSRKTHLIFIKKIYSVYDKAILYFLPLKKTAHPHYVILGGGSKINLRANTYFFDSQVLQFSKYFGLFSVQYYYNIWKRQLGHDINDVRYHYQTINIRQSQSEPLNINIYCKQMYKQQQKLPIILVITDKNQQFDQNAFKQVLQKGTMIIQFCGRGSFSKDLLHLLAGSRKNINKLMDDLQQTIEYIGNNMSDNISLYCKGQISSLIGLWFNIYFPNLFNSSVLHNGIYNLKKNQIKKIYFGQKQEQKQSIADKFHIYHYRFQNINNQAILKPKQIQQNKFSFEIGSLENIIISSDFQHREHSRQLLYFLRQNINNKYKTVYLKEFNDKYHTDLQNFSYIYSKIKDRLQQEHYRQYNNLQDN